MSYLNTREPGIKKRGETCRQILTTKDISISKLDIKVGERLEDFKNGKNSPALPGVHHKGSHKADNRIHSNLKKGD